MVDDFNIDINELIKRLEGTLKPERVSESIRNLVTNGLIEQYTDEEGNFVFELTDIGKEVAKQIDEGGFNDFLQGGGN
jgi:DNA-binding MarR family transcriptional regulator